MKTIVTAAQMKALDAFTIRDIGILSLVLMERAALKTAQEIQKISEAGEKLLVVCGSGNNGGDGIAVARILHGWGFTSHIWLAGNPDKMTPETAQQAKIAGASGVPFVNNPVLDEYTTIVDAVFGVGLSRPVEGRYREILARLNAARAKKVAVDLPSGVNADTGQEMGIAFRADLTVTFAFLKRGLCLYPGRFLAGKTVVADIGIYEQDSLPEKFCGCNGNGAAQPEIPSGFARHLEKEDLTLLPERVPWGNKGTFGKVLFVTGSKGMCGAAYLSAAAALRGGAGMVKIQTVEENRLPLQILLPEAMVDTDFEEQNNQRLLDWCDVLVIGPGLGTSAESRERAHWFLSRGSAAKKPMVLDADGLNLLAENPSWKEFLGPETVLTPHMGEMSRLTGIAVSELKKDAPLAACDYAAQTGAVCVLKDACTVTADWQGQVYLNLSGNAGMATAGSGDVLSGILAAVFCMCPDAKKSGKDCPDNAQKAALAVYLHGLCGDLAAKKNGTRGMKAGDILVQLPKILKDSTTKNSRSCQQNGESRF